MGFFDALDSLLEDKEKYSKGQLMTYFSNEINSDKLQNNTGLRDFIKSQVKKILPDAHHIKVNKPSSEVINENEDGTYTITYRGSFGHIEDSWGVELQKEKILFYEVVINTDKYAKIVEDKESTVEVFAKNRV